MSNYLNNSTSPYLLQHAENPVDWYPWCEEIKKLYNYRKKRARLHLDDKILLSWNALMIAALSMLYRVSHKEKYLQAAQNAERFIEQNLCNDVWLFTSWRDGKCSEKSFLDDYAFYIASLIELYNSTLDKAYLKKSGTIL